MKKWTRGAALFETACVFVPIEYSLHWSLAVVVNPLQLCLSRAVSPNDAATAVDVDGDGQSGSAAGAAGLPEPEPGIYHLDSLGRHSPARIGKALREWLIRAFLDTDRGKIDVKARHAEAAAAVEARGDAPKADKTDIAVLRKDLVRFKKAKTVKSPQQHNGTDCGLFVLANAESLCSAEVNLDPARYVERGRCCCCTTTAATTTTTLRCCCACHDCAPADVLPPFLLLLLLLSN